MLSIIITCLTKFPGKLTETAAVVFYCQYLVYQYAKVLTLDVHKQLAGHQKGNLTCKLYQQQSLKRFKQEIFGQCGLTHSHDIKLAS